jgi:heavy metal sensor kinase
MRVPSIRSRLTTAYAAVFALTFVVAGIGAMLALRESVATSADADLRARVRAARDYLELAPRVVDQHLIDGLGEHAGSGGFGTYVRVAGPDGKWLFRSPATARWPAALPERRTLPEEGAAMTLTVDGSRMRILTAPVSIGTVQIGFPLGEFDRLMRHFAWFIGLGSPLLLILAAFGGYWISGRALRAVDETATAARRIGAANLSERLPSRGNGDELDRLSETLNGMLARLEQSFNRITQFTADASHELRTPIAIIRATAEVTRSQPRSPEEQQKAWHVVLTQTERTSRVIEDLLFLARADSGSSGLTLETVDLPSVIREASEEMNLVAKSAGISISTSSLPGCSIRGDAEALRRVWLILLDNAIKFTPNGGSVRISLEMTTSSPPCAEVTVSDTGVGIAAKDIPHVFDRFYRASQDRSRKSGGAGLGLSIAHWIVAAHHGQLGVQSTPGIGSTFMVRLPLA